MIDIMLANGFEEIEAVTTYDILRRCGLQVAFVSVANTKKVVGAHKVSIMADDIFQRDMTKDCEAIILPGGMPGADNLLHHEGLRKMLTQQDKEEKLIAAICAAPMVLGHCGLLAGRKATCYPGFENHLRNAIKVEATVVKDGHIITSQGPATVTDFAFEIARHFVSDDIVRQVRESMLYD